MEDEDDHQDFVVADNGFVRQWNVQLSDDKYSDSLSNGDSDDDKELEDADEHHDHIVSDNGFVKQFLV